MNVRCDRNLTWNTAPFNNIIYNTLIAYVLYKSYGFWTRFFLKLMKEYGFTNLAVQSAYVTNILFYDILSHNDF